MKKQKKYISPASTEQDCGAPTQAKFEISISLAKEIIRLAYIVRENDLYAVEKFNYSVRWTYNRRRGVSEPVELPCIHVSSNDFWFTAFLKHSNIEVKTEEHPIRQLADFFSLPYQSQRQ